MFLKGGVELNGAKNGLASIPFLLNLSCITWESVDCSNGLSTTTVVIHAPIKQPVGSGLKP